MESAIDHPVSTDLLSQPETPEDAQSVKVYSYACKIRNAEDAALVQEQISLAHKHRNTLTEALLKGRTAHRAIIKEHLGLEIKELETEADQINSQIKTIRDQIGKYKKANRTKRTEPQLALELKSLQKIKKPIQEKIKLAKEAAKENPIIKPLLEKINRDTDLAITAARAHFSKELGLYWGTYLENERAAKQARYQTMDPKFHRWTWEGSLAIRFQNGLSVQELFECQDTRLRLQRPPENAIRPNGQMRGPGRRVQALFRAGSKPDKSPKWVTLEVIMHWPLPRYGIIKWARLQRTPKPGSTGKSNPSLVKDYHYALQLIVEKPTTPPACDLKVAVEVGWRLLPKGLRVAVAVGEDKEIKELYLPPEWLDGCRKTEAIRSAMDNETNEVAKAIKTANPELATKLALAGDKTGWLTSLLLSIRTQYAEKRPSLEEITRLICEWRLEARQQIQIPGQEAEQPRLKRGTRNLLKAWLDTPELWNRPEIVLELWREHHFHLFRYQKGLHGRLLRSRREIYRKFVAELAAKYSICGVEDFDLRKIHRKDLTKDEAQKNIKWQAKVAAISTLTTMLVHRLQTRKFPGGNTTRECHRCGSIEQWDQQREVWHQCSNCGTLWDQDHNAGFNLLNYLLRETPEGRSK
jgi:Putative transposase DNA-binding domain